MNSGLNVSLAELGQRWGELFSQALAQIISLEKQIATLQAEIARLNGELERLPVDLLSPDERAIAQRPVKSVSWEK